MKKTKLDKKLPFNKATVSNLDSREMNGVAGGATFTGGCDTCCSCYTYCFTDCGTCDTCQGNVCPA